MVSGLVFIFGFVLFVIFFKKFDNKNSVSLHDSIDSTDHSHLLEGLISNSDNNNFRILHDDYLGELQEMVYVKSKIKYDFYVLFTTTIKNILPSILYAIDIYNNSSEKYFNLFVSGDAENIIKNYIILQWIHHCNSTTFNELLIFINKFQKLDYLNPINTKQSIDMFITSLSY